MAHTTSPRQGNPTTSLTSSRAPAGPARLCSGSCSAGPASPRRVFRTITYPKRLTKPAASYLANLQALLAAYVPWMTHLQLCVYHIWALIWALSKPWSCPLWHAQVFYKPLAYGLLHQHCFLVDSIHKLLCSHNWRGALAERVRGALA